MKKDLEVSGLTKQRRAVYRVIEESNEHLTANEVFENARRHLPGISFATVYNSLRFLKDEGFIAEVRFGADASRYDRKLTRHDHAICRDCGTLVDIDLPVPEKLLKKASKLSKFKSGTIELILHGLCPKCVKK